MATSFVLPIGSPGAPQNVSSAGGGGEQVIDLKCGADDQLAVNIEVSNNGGVSYALLRTVKGTGQYPMPPGVYQFMRAVLASGSAAGATCAFGAEGEAVNVAALAVPAAGNGASTALGTDSGRVTIVAKGLAVDAVLNVEESPDNVAFVRAIGDDGTPATVYGPDDVLNANLAGAGWVRLVRVSGAVGGTASVGSAPANAAAPPSGPAGGDLAGAYPNPTVKALRGVAANVVPIDGGGATVTLKATPAAGVESLIVSGSDGVAVGVNGGFARLKGGDGAAADAVTPGGTGGDSNRLGGAGGAGSAAQVSGAGGSADTTAGNAGADAGGGGNAGGNVTATAGNSTGTGTTGGAFTRQSGAGGPGGAGGGFLDTAANGGAATAAVPGGNGGIHAVVSGNGGAASAAQIAGPGGVIQRNGGAGGAANAANAAGNGASILDVAGNGGNGSAGALAANGGDIQHTPGLPGASGGFGPGHKGTIIEAGAVAYTPHTQNIAVVGDAVDSEDSSINELSNTAGAPLVLTSTPTVKAGRQTGQRLLLVNITANAITLQSDGVVPGTNLFLGAAGRALAVNGILELVWTSAGKWQEVGFLNTAS